MAKIAVIVGSMRSERHGIKVAKWVVSKLEEKPNAIHFSLGGPWFGGSYKDIKYAQDWEDEKLLYRNTVDETRPTQWVKF